MLKNITMNETMMKEGFRLDAKISDFVARPFSGDVNDSVTQAAKIMRDRGVGAILVAGGGEFKGIVTERDVLYKVVAEGRNPTNVKLRTVMSSPIHTIEYTATAGDAIAKMSRLKVRRLAVTENETIVGLVTQKSIIVGEEGEKLTLPELNKPNVLRCPYCEEEVRDVNDLSRHIDLVHIGKGLLEGNLSKW
jgi:CBS domain-containing protein